MSNNDRTIRHGEMMYELGQAFGAGDARSLMLNALHTAKYRTLSEDEINAVIASVDALIKKHTEDYQAIWDERIDALS